MLDLVSEEKTVTSPSVAPTQTIKVDERVAERGSSLAALLNLWNLRNLISLMVHRDFTGRYKGSLLGALWPLLNPLGHMFLYTFLFNVILQVRFGKNAGTGDFALYLMCGFLPWSAMAESIASSTTKVLELPNLVKRVVFPLETLPLIVSISSFLSGSISIVLLILFAAFRQHGLHSTILFVPLIFIPHFLFTAGLSWFFGSLGVFVRDCRHFIALALSAWMYMTPILYPPERMPAHLQFLLWLNPMAGIITDYRHVIIEGQLPNFAWYAEYSLVSLVVFLLGFHFFYKTKHSFADIV
ncbi:MAG: ABC transporter permease [Candidatus Obscuribacterales bacterium]|nr:ABC transporter permease [Candidatus Obscuribacterales bacterium]